VGLVFLRMIWRVVFTSMLQGWLALRNDKTAAGTDFRADTSVPGRQKDK
jgi:hypothetical protein